MNNQGNNQEQVSIYGGYIYAAKNGQSLVVPTVLLSAEDRETVIGQLIEDAKLHFPAHQGYTGHFANVSALGDLFTREEWREPEALRSLVRMLIGDERYAALMQNPDAAPGMDFQPGSPGQQ